VPDGSDELKHVVHCVAL